MSPSIETAPPASWLTETVEIRRLQINSQLRQRTKTELGQFFSPGHVARLVASKFKPIRGDVRLLDAGAGIGSLTAAFVERILHDPTSVSSCELVAFEIDVDVVPFLRQCLEDCCRALLACGIPARHYLHVSNFLHTVETPSPSLFPEMGDFAPTYTHAILNPPYKKINSTSTTRKLLSEAGIETSNLYSAFVWLALLQLQGGGELAAITPRSFCNGAYFRPFRQALLSKAALDSVHLFESRSDAFSDDEVLQENLIFHLVRSDIPSESVTVCRSSGPDDESATVMDVPFNEVVQPADPEKYIHIVADEFDAALKREMAGLPLTLQQLGLSVSTGPVVDFRMKAWLQFRAQSTEQNCPLTHPPTSGTLDITGRCCLVPKPGFGGASSVLYFSRHRAFCAVVTSSPCAHRPAKSATHTPTPPQPAPR